MDSKSKQSKQGKPNPEQAQAQPEQASNPVNPTVTGATQPAAPIAEQAEQSKPAPIAEQAGKAITVYAEGLEDTGIKVQATLPPTLTVGGKAQSTFNAAGKINGNSARWGLLHFGAIVPLNLSTRLIVDVDAAEGYVGKVQARLHLVAGKPNEGESQPEYHEGLVWTCEVYGKQAEQAKQAESGKQAEQAEQAEQAVKSFTFARCLSKRVIPEVKARAEQPGKPAVKAHAAYDVIDNRMDYELATRRAIAAILPAASTPTRAARVAPAPLEVDVTGASTVEALYEAMRKAGIILKGAQL